MIERVRRCVLASSVAVLLTGAGCAGPADAPATVDAASGRISLARPQQTAEVVVIVNVTVIDPGSAPRPNASVLIRDGRIAQVVDSMVRIPDDANAIEVDGTDMFLIPGLWDAHAHLTYPGECALPLLVAHGVTAVRDLGGTMDLAEWRARVDGGEIVGPHIWMAGPNIETKAWMDGAREHMVPFLEGTGYESYDVFGISPRLEVASEDDARAAVDSLLALGVDIAKFRNLDRDNFRAFAAAARRHGLPLAGHGASAISLADAAEAGQGSIEHSDALTINLGELDAPELQSQLRRIRDAGTMITPTLVSGVYRPDEHVRAVMADSTGSIEERQRYVSRGQHEMWGFMFATRGAGGPPDPSGRRKEIAMVRAAHEAGVPVLAGTDLGILLTYPGSSVHEELEILVREVGLTPAQALAAATINPARVLGVDDQLGRIRPGYVADLVLLSADPLEDIGNVGAIEAVIWRGRVLRRADLEELRAAARSAVRNGGRACRVEAARR